MISIIIPLFNVEDYLPVCLNSVLNQSYQNFEIICVDDASTDSSLDILEYFHKKDCRITILKNKNNKGPGYSRNRGLEIARGEYVYFLDGDDWISPNTLEIVIEKSKQDNLDVLLFKNVVYYQNNQNFRMEKYYNMDFMDVWESKVFNHWDLDKTKIFSISNAPWNKLYLKSFLDENNIRFPNENLIHEDNPFFYKVFTTAKRMSILNKFLHTRRRRHGSITTLTNERVFDNIDIIYKILEVFLEDKTLYEYYKKEILHYIFAVISKGKYNMIDGEYKDDFYKNVQVVFQRFVEDYGLYEDIKRNVDKKILDFFKFEDIVGGILS